MENVYTKELRKLVEEIPNTSAWKRGIKEYTDELLDNLEEKAQSYERLPRNGKELEEWLLNGATHNTEIPLTYEIVDGFNNVIKCFVDYRLLHTTSYGIVVEGNDENEMHFRFSMLPKEGFLVVNNTSGMNITDDVQVIDISGRCGWGISTGADLTNYYTKITIDNLLNEKADKSALAKVATSGDYNDLTNKPVVKDQVQSDWNENDKTKPDYIKNKPDLSQYIKEQDLNNYYDKGEVDVMLNNKVDTSTLPTRENPFCP